MKFRGKFTRVGHRSLALQDKLLNFYFLTEEDIARVNRQYRDGYTHMPYTEYMNMIIGYLDQGYEIRDVVNVS